MIKQSKAPKNAGTKVTFVLPAEHPAGTVSVVGNFNSWTPGRTVLRKRSNGTRSASVVVEPGTIDEGKAPLLVLREEVQRG